MKKQTQSAPRTSKKKVAAVAVSAAEKAKAGKKSGRKADRKAPEKAKPAPGEAPKVRIKLVRDSFTMPREDFERIARLKARAIEFKRPAKKSELLRAGLQALAKMDDKSLHAALAALTPIKTGRPKKR